MRFTLLFTLILVIIWGCTKDETVNTGGGLETETISNITGIIVDSENDFVENARIIATKSDGDIIVSSDTVFTGADGLYKFTALDTGTFSFEADKTINNAPYQVTIGSHYNNKSAFHFGIDTLLATGYICGMVTTEDPKENYMGIDVYIPGTSFSAHSDRYGRFTMSFVSLGSYQIAFDEPGYEIDTSQTVELQNPGDTVWLESVVLKEKLGDEYFSIDGTYLRQYGLPIYGSTVRLEKLNDVDSVVKSYTATTDNDGQFQFRKGEVGRFRFSLCDTIQGLIYKHSYIKVFDQPYPKVLDPFTMLPQTGYLQGFAKRELDSVQFNGIKVSIPELSIVSTTNPQGIYNLREVPPGTYTLQFTATKHDTLLSTVTVTNDRDTTFIDSVVLNRTDTTFTINGSLLFPTGEIANGAEVRLHKFNANDSIISTKKTNVNWHGNYEFIGNYPGTYAIAADIKVNDTLYADSSMHIFSKIETVTLPPDTLQKYDPQRGYISGMVSKSGSSDSRFIKVSLDHTEISTDTDEDGNFLLSDIPFGNYDLKYYYKGYIITSTKVTVTNSYDTVTIAPVTLETVKSAVIPMVYIESDMFKDLHYQTACVDSFYIGKTEITLEQYQLFDSTWVNLSGTQAYNEPVAGISLSQAIQFCNWLSIREGFDTCYTIDPNKKAFRVYGDSIYWMLNPSKNGYRLPSGDEWEHAANGKPYLDPQGYQFATDDGELRIGNKPSESNAWLPTISDNQIQKVRSFGANSHGVYDMTGNVWEYTWEASTDFEKGDLRSNHFVDDLYMNTDNIQVRGASAIWPDMMKPLAKEDMRVQKSHLADSKRSDFFSDAARGFRIVRRY